MRHRSERSGEQGVFARMLDGLAAEAAVPKAVMSDAAHLKAHRAATGLRAKRGGDRRGRLIGRTRGGVNTQLHAVAGADGRPTAFS